MKRTITGGSSICLRSMRPSVSVGVARSTVRARTVARAAARIPQGRAEVGRPSRGDSTMPAAAVFVGIDVAKAELVIAVRPSGERWTAANDEASIQGLLKRLRRHAPTLVVLEATGGYERTAVAALAAARLPLVVANPRQVRDFARATGELAKTDRIDADTLALFGERVRPAPRVLPDEAATAFDALLTRRRQILGMIVAERNRLEHALPAVRGGITQHIHWLERQLQDVDRDLEGEPGVARQGRPPALRAWRRPRPQSHA